MDAAPHPDTARSAEEGMLLSSGIMCAVSAYTKRPHSTGAVGRGLRVLGRGRAR
jgi:hypothetical protein